MNPDVNFHATGIQTIVKSVGIVMASRIKMWQGQKKIYVCLRSPDLPYFSAADPNLFNRQLFDPNFC